MTDLREAGAPDELLILTQSEMACWLEDRREWFLSYYLCRRPRYDHAFIPDVGTFYHAGLEAYYREQADPLAVVQRRAEAVIEQEPPEHAVADLLKAAELAAIMLEGYLEWCPEHDAHLQILGAEEKVEVQLGHEFLLRGKIDARAIDLRSGARIQLEHKTVGSLDELPKYAQSNFQFLTYDLLALLIAKAAEDPDVRTDGVLLNMARRVKRTKTANPPFYGRHEVRHNVHELRAHYRHVLAVGRQIWAARAQLSAGVSHHEVCPPHVTRNSTWSNRFLSLYPVMDDGGDWLGMLEDLYEPYDPLERYEEEGD